MQYFQLFGGMLESCLCLLAFNELLSKARQGFINALDCKIQQETDDREYNNKGCRLCDCDCKVGRRQITILFCEQKHEDCHATDASRPDDGTAADRQTRCHNCQEV